MSISRLMAVLASAALLGLAGCASRPVNPPLTQVHADGGYTFQSRQKHFKSQETLVVLAFSGGGTRAAAFSYGVLEYLRKTVIVAPNGDKLRLLDAVDMITGVSGGSFTALAYGLYGEKLFTDYEQRFLKRDVQGELLARSLSPRYWGDYIGGTAGRSELAANYYDEILFNGATFGDLDKATAPTSSPRPQTSPPARACPSTRAYSTCCARTSTPCACREPPRHRRPCPWCCPPSPSTTMAAAATTRCRPG